MLTVICVYALVCIQVFRETLGEVLPQAIPCFDAHAFERCISIDHHYIEKMLKS